MITKHNVADITLLAREVSKIKSICCPRGCEQLVCEAQSTNQVLIWPLILSLERSNAGSSRDLTLIAAASGVPKNASFQACEWGQ